MFAEFKVVLSESVIVKLLITLMSVFPSVKLEELSTVTTETSFTALTDIEEETVVEFAVPSFTTMSRLRSVVLGFSEVLL